jgi:hypothetical protein
MRGNAGQNADGRALVARNKYAMKTCEKLI